MEKNIKMSVVSLSSVLMNGVKGNYTVSLGFEHFALGKTYYKYNK